MDQSKEPASDVNTPRDYEKKIVALLVLKETMGGKSVIGSPVIVVGQVRVCGHGGHSSYRDRGLTWKGTSDKTA